MIDLPKGRSARLALIGSFYVYLLPIVGPHAGWLVGGVLFQTGTDWIWRLASWGWVLGVQALSYFFFRFCSRFKFGLLLAPVAVPLAWFVVLIGLMGVIPRWRLVEDDSRTDHGSLTEVCRLEGKWITLSGQFDRMLLSERRPELLLQDSNAQKYFFLRVPGCALTEIPFPKSAPEQAFAPVQTARGSHILYTTARRGRSNLDYGIFADGKVVPLEPFKELDHSKLSQPRLSPDGGALAWIVRVPGKGGELRTGAVGATGVRDSSRFDLGALGAGSYEILDVTDGAREVLLARNLREYLLVSAGGKVLWQLIPEGGVRPILGTFRVTPGSGGSALRDYTAWEGYRDEGRYLIQWRRGDKIVQKAIPLGRLISSADASPDGRFLAASTSPSVSLGGIEDMVVIWSSDGTEVFRRRLGPYNRSPVVFLGSNLVAYSESGPGGHGVTRVLKLW